MRHAGQLERELSPSSPELALPPASLRASAPAAEFALDGTPWQAMRRQQEAISAAHAQRLSEMRFSAVGRWFSGAARWFSAAGRWFSAAGGSVSDLSGITCTPLLDPLLDPGCAMATGGRRAKARARGR
jgi:hypothetical protein